jgi:hypothetical protein
MSETFRSKVEEILEDYKGFKIYERNAEDIVDRICAALKERVEGMPTILNPYEYVQDQCPGEYKIIEKAITEQREACKSYMLEGLDDR